MVVCLDWRRPRRREIPPDTELLGFGLRPKVLPLSLVVLLIIGPAWILVVAELVL